MKINQMYKEAIEKNTDLPPLSDFPEFKAPKDRLPELEVSTKSLSDAEINYYYQLASDYLAAAEDATGWYNSKETFVLNQLEGTRQIVFRENFSGKDKGGNSENRNSIVETDSRVEELRSDYITIKAQRQKMERKIKSIAQKVIKYGGERKQRREGKWVGSDSKENLQESF